MIENFKEIGLDKAKGTEEIDKLLQEHIGIQLSQCADALSISLQERADELEDLISLAPHGDYDKLLDNREAMIKFLKEEAHKPEHWSLEYLEYKKEDSQLLELLFYNKAVDDGDVLKGFVFVGISGKIRHAFVQMG